MTIEQLFFLCRYRGADGECGTPIVLDGESPSGFSHAAGRDWCHWAAPMAYGPQDSQAAFVKRALVEGLKVEEGKMAQPRAERCYRSFGVHDTTCYLPKGHKGRHTGMKKAAMREVALEREPRAAQHLKREQEPAPGELRKTIIEELYKRHNGLSPQWIDDFAAFVVRVAAQPPQELASLREACIQSLAEHEAIYEVMLLEPRNKGMQPPAIIAKLRAALTRGAVGG